MHSMAYNEAMDKVYVTHKIKKLQMNACNGISGAFRTTPSVILNIKPIDIQQNNYSYIILLLYNYYIRQINQRLKIIIVRGFWNLGAAK